MGTLPYVVEDFDGLLKLYNDGSIFRTPHELPCASPLLNDDSIVFKDLVFDQKHNLHLRLYKPAAATAVSTTCSDTKLPILFYFHGGGFCFGTRKYPNFHNLSMRLAAALNMLVIAPDLRLAPEHRLPAAADDARFALKWLQGQAKAMHGIKDDGKVETWLTCVDFDRVFVLGDSSGGNMAHHLAAGFEAGSAELAPVRVRGYVLLSPFFGGNVRTRREEEQPFETFWNMEKYERFWRLSVPIGSTFDHPLVNPFGPYSQSLAEVQLDPILVLVGENEILRDRAVDYATRLKHLGKKIEIVEFAGEQHGFFTDNPFSEVAEKVIQHIRDFILENSK